MSDGLVDLIDRLVDTGVGVGGDVTLSVAGVDLIALRLQAILNGVGTEGADELVFPQRRAKERLRQLRSRIDASADPQGLQRGLAQVVLVLVELLGELMGRQAVRRMSAGTLNDEQTHDLGRTFTALHEQIDELHARLLDEGRSAEPALRSPAALIQGFRPRSSVDRAAVS